MIIENELLLAELRLPGRCCLCNRMCHVREPAHIIAKGMGSGRRLDVPLNLLSLGSTTRFECECHRKLHDQRTHTEEQLMLYAASREGAAMNGGEVFQLLWQIINNPKAMMNQEDCEHNQAWRVGREWWACRGCAASIPIRDIGYGIWSKVEYVR